MGVNCQSECQNFTLKARGFSLGQAKCEGLARAEKAARNGLDCFIGGHYHGIILIQSDIVAFAIGADNIRMQDEGQTFKFGFHFIFEFIAFIDAQPELVMRGSTTTDFDFSNTQERLVVIVVFCEKRFDFFSCLRRESDLKHEILQNRVMFCADLRTAFAEAMCRPFLPRQQQKVHPLMRENKESPGRSDRYFEAFAVITGHIQVQNEGDAVEGPAYFVLAGAVSVEHQPELGMSVSGTADFDFMDTKKNVFRAFKLRKSRFQPCFSFRRKDDLKHGVFPF